MAEPFLAEIRVFPYGFIPKGWAACDGQLLPISSNAALYSLIGATYGGDGRTNFALPDLRGRVPVHPGRHGITYGQSAGESSHTLTTQEMPAHNHQAQADSNDATTNQPSGGVWAKTSNGSYAAQANVSMSPLALGTAGNSQPHNNLQPYNVLTFCIATTGIYPPRN